MSWKLIEALSHMSKQLKEQEREQQEQQWQLPVQNEKLDGLVSILAGDEQCME